MRKILEMLAVLGLVAVLALAALALQEPAGSVTVSLPAGSLQTSVPVAAGVLAGLLVLVYYLGQLALWLGSLPGVFQNRGRDKRRAGFYDQLNGALVLEALGQQAAAARGVKALPGTADAAGLRLAQLAGLRLETLEPTQVQALRHDGLLGALACLTLAHRAARAGDWTTVRSETQQGLTQAPDSPLLLGLQLKALLNLDDTKAARALLPQVLPHLNPATRPLLERVVDGGATPDGAVGVVGHPWAKHFQDWLGNAQAQVPEVSAGATAHKAVMTTAADETFR